MSSHLGETQLALLAYLREHSGGYAQRIGLDPKPVAKGLRIDHGELVMEASALVRHGLVGVRGFRPDAGHPASEPVPAIWLTGRGEDYLRRLEADPGVRRRVTVTSVKEMGRVLGLIAAKVLKDFVAGPR